MWIRAATVTDIPPGEGCELVVAGRIVAIFHYEGAFYAMDGICPHQGGPLGAGKLHGCVVTCPWHGWQFDVRNGQHQASALLRHPVFATKIEGCEVWIDLPAE